MCARPSDVGYRCSLGGAGHGYEGRCRQRGQLSRPESKDVIPHSNVVLQHRRYRRAPENRKQKEGRSLADLLAPAGYSGRIRPASSSGYNKSPDMMDEVLGTPPSAATAGALEACQNMFDQVYFVPANPFDDRNNAEDESRY